MTAAVLTIHPDARRAGDACSGSDLSLDVVTDRSSYAAGATVTMTATLRWTGALPCGLPPAQQAVRWDVLPDGRPDPVWDSVCDPSPLGHTVRATACVLPPAPTALPPGGTLVVVHAWSQQRDGREPAPADPGVYRLTVDVGRLTASTSFVLTS